MMSHRMVLVAFLATLSMFTMSCNKDNNDGGNPPKKETILQFIYTSDQHFGITRKSFRGASNVDATIVNQAMVDQINKLPETTLPSDGGVNAGKVIGAIDFVVSTGDIANRREKASGSAGQSAAASWAQFETIYINGLTVKNSAGTKAPLFVTPGNHDISNAIGQQKITDPTWLDNTSMFKIYNSMMKPTTQYTSATYKYSKGKTNYRQSFKGVSFLFLNVWPDTETRTWISSTIRDINEPVILLTHDQPDIESKHLMDPASVAATDSYMVSTTGNFENLVTDKAPAGSTASTYSTSIEQQNLSTFLSSTPKIKAYFHGNDNHTEFYTFGNITSIPVFRVDSPMKGNYSANDPTKLAFEVVTINTLTMEMTVRECLWNKTDSANDAIQWGISKTISLK